MGQRGTIEIRVSGSKGNLSLSPDHYDINEITQMFDIVATSAILANVQQSGSIDKLDLQTARAIENPKGNRALPQVK